MEDLETKHQREKDELEKQIAEMLSSAKGKNERKRLNQKAEQMRRELFEKQSEESPDIYADIAQEALSHSEKPPEVEVPIPEPPKKKKNQAAQKAKRERKQREQYNLEAAISDALSNTKSKKEIETEQILSEISKLGLTIRPVIGDGHCLYRSFAISLSNIGHSDYASPNSYLQVRKACFAHLKNM